MCFRGLSTRIDPMRSFYVENFGCRATQADGAALERELLDRGYRRAVTSQQASVVIVNTCTVTNSADQQARQAVRRFHRENPMGRILVTGCYAQRAPHDLAAIPGVNWVVGNSHKSEIPRFLERELPAENRPQGAFDVPLSSLAPTPDEWTIANSPAKVITGNVFEQTQLLSAPVFGNDRSGERTRPTLKIQDGCNNRCSYCVIPFVRGHSRSLAPDAVVEQVKQLVDAGYKEVVLSGINLGSYGRDCSPRATLLRLIECILKETPLPRLRLSSIEPMDITPDYISLVASSDRIARHFHVPLQSGSDRILRAMHRWYKAAEYGGRIAAIRECLPDAGIGADVMVGFPGERDDDFDATRRLIEELPFTYLHVFTFSKRPGTRAFTLGNEVPPLVAKARSTELRALAAEKNRAFREQQIGRELSALTLATPQGGADGAANAISDNYLKVAIRAADLPSNEFFTVRVTGLTADGLEANL